MSGKGKSNMLQSYANNLQKLANVYVYFSSNFGADKN